MSLIAQSVRKVLGEPPLTILSDITLEIKNGEFVAITGRSGSGKSTLLYLLSSLDPPTEGKVSIDGRDLGALSRADIERLRNEEVGFIFQFHFLLAELTALENVLMPAVKAGRRDERRAHARKLLEDFGLGDKLHRLPRHLSGGEQQRLAIARALVMEPRYLFADEPTGQLDSVSGDLVMSIIREANKLMRTTVLLVTHDPDYAALADRQIRLADGRIVP